MKQTLALLLLVFLSLSLFSCTRAPEEAPSPETSEEAVNFDALLYDYDLSEYITLPDYMGMTLKRSDVTASEEEVAARMKADFLGKDVSRAVAPGDTIVLDYVGKKDGVAFQGGTAYDYELKIGSGSFIDGFEEGLVGVMPGETVDLNLTFPTDYHNEELRGVAVVFTATVDYIKTDSLELPTLTDEMVKILTDYESAEDYQTRMPQELSNTLLENAVQTYLFENAVIHSLPEDALDAHRAIYIDDVKAMLAPYGLELNAYLSKLGMSEKEFQAKVDEYAKNAVESDLILYSVAREQNITPTEEQREKTLNEIFRDYQKEFSISDMDALTELLGEDADKLILQRVIIDYICEHVVLED